MKYDILREYPWYSPSPDETGLDVVFVSDQENDEFPYDRAMSADEPQDPTGQFGGSHGQITPKDTSHSVWESVIREAGGLGMSFVSSSPGGMTGVTPGSSKFGGNPFDTEIDDDELEKAGRPDRSGDRVGDDVDNMVKLGDHDLERYLAAMKKDQDPVDFPGSAAPSDIVVFSGDGFTQGLGQATKSHRGLYGIADDADRDMPDKTVWPYLERLLPDEI